MSGEQYHLESEPTQPGPNHNQQTSGEDEMLTDSRYPASTPLTENGELDLNAVMAQAKAEQDAGKPQLSLAEVMESRLAEGRNPFHELHVQNPELHDEDPGPTTADILGALAAMRAAKTPGDDLGQDQSDVTDSTHESNQNK